MEVQIVEAFPYCVRCQLRSRVNQTMRTNRFVQLTITPTLVSSTAMVLEESMILCSNLV
jgi:hypothetical protein